MATYKRGNSWWVNFRHNRIRHRKKSPDNSQTGAKAYEASLRQQLARGETLQTAKERRKQNEQHQTFAEFAKQWVETYAKINNKVSEVQNKRYTLNRHLIPFFGKIEIGSISLRDTEEYKIKKKNECLANKTINNHLIVLNKCLKTAQELYDLPNIPKIKKLKLPPIQTNYLTAEECNKLIASAEGVWREAILAFLKTGMRLGELIALQWNDVDWNNRAIVVRRSWSNAKNGFDTPKSNRERHIKLADDLYDTLYQRKWLEGLIFTVNGKRIGSSRMNRMLKKFCRKAGIREISCHILRHTFASHLAMQGKNQRKIQLLLGHASSLITERYMHLSPDSLGGAIDSLDSLYGLPLSFGHYVDTTEKRPSIIVTKQKNQIA